MIPNDGLSPLLIRKVISLRAGRWRHNGSHFETNFSLNQIQQVMTKRSLAENLSDSNLASVELLITDAKTGLTLLDLAETTKIPEVRSRRIAEAPMLTKRFSLSLHD